jgi:hypothetical protein
MDRLGIARHRVAQPLHRPAPPRQVLLRRRGRRLQDAHATEPTHDRDQLGRRRRAELEAVLEQHHGVVGVARVRAVQDQVAGHIGTGHAEVTGRGEQVGQPTLAGQVQPNLGVGRSGRAAVVRREVHGQLVAQQVGNRFSDLHRCRTALS